MTMMTAPPLTQNFLSFSVNEQVSGLLSAMELVEVLSVKTEAIVPISGTSAAVMGVCNWRGEVLWLVDVGALLQVGRLCDRNLLLSKYDVIIAKSAGGPIGLVVEAIDQMCWIDPDEIQLSPPQGTALPILLPYLQGYWQSPEQPKTFALLDLEGLLQNL
jgi:positive phototaxis protein PixI